MDAKSISLTLLVSLVVLASDYFFYQALRAVFFPVSQRTNLFFRQGYWILTALWLLHLWGLVVYAHWFVGTEIRRYSIRYLFLVYGAKMVLVVLMLVRESWYWAQKIFRAIRKPPNPLPQNRAISRSDFLAQAALLGGSLPLALMSYGIVWGGREYQVRRLKIYLPGLPAAFQGMRLGQISDLHLGSFFDARPVRQGVEVLLGEKPDIICFTGDLVNYETAEAKPYFAILQSLKAPLGVFSVLGNHDYGGYRKWPNAEAARQNLRQMYALHQALGWQLLCNAHVFLEENQEKIALIGVENWGIRKPHPRYGDVEKAKQGTAEASVRILLSHDPSHWEAQVQPLAPEIDLMLAGHTHGFQCGIEMGNWQWSPGQYIYPQWAGLYQAKAQQLYVNRGFGYADIFPGRIGMPPEITVLELLKA